MYLNRFFSVTGITYMKQIYSCLYHQSLIWVTNNQLLAVLCTVCDRIWENRPVQHGHKRCQGNIVGYLAMQACLDVIWYQLASPHNHFSLLYPKLFRAVPPHQPRRFFCPVCEHMNSGRRNVRSMRAEVSTCTCTYIYVPRNIGIYSISRLLNLMSWCADCYGRICLLDICCLGLVCVIQPHNCISLDSN